MKRREFIAGLGGAAAWPLAVHAQQQPIVGYLTAGNIDKVRVSVAAFNRGLRNSGYVEGRNVTIEYRGAEGRADVLPRLVADLLQRRVAVLVTTGTLAAIEAKRATETTPIVFALGADPVKFGLVASLNRPGGNATGVSFLVNTMVAKQFEILHQAVSKATVIGFLVNPVNPNTEPDIKDVEAAAERLGHKLRVVNASTEREIDLGIKIFGEERISALFVHNDPLLLLRREQIVALAAYHAIPAMYPFSEFVVAGGLMSYGTDRIEPYRLAGEYCGRILKGAKPADLPVQLSTKFEFVINLKTAKALALEIPLPLLVAADEVIQ